MGSGGAFLDVDGDGGQDILLVNSKEWPPAGPQLAARPLPQQRRRHVHRRHEAGRPGRRDLRPGRRRRGLRQRRRGRRVPDRARAATGSSGTWAADDSRTSPPRPAWAAAASAPAPSSSTTTRTASSTSSSQLRGVVDREGPLLHARRHAQVLLHARVVQGQSPILYRNKGDGTLRGRDGEGGPARARTPRRWAWPCWTTTATAGHDLFVANDTQPNKLYRNNGNGTFTDVGMAAGVAFSEAGVARAGMGVDAADYDALGPAQRGHRQLLERDDGALPQRGRPASSSTRRPPPPSARPRC